MPETLNFHGIAKRIADEASSVSPIMLQGAIHAALRQVWNARGAADIAALKSDSVAEDYELGCITKLDR